MVPLSGCGFASWNKKSGWCHLIGNDCEMSESSNINVWEKLEKIEKMSVYIPMCPKCPQCVPYSELACISATLSMGFQLANVKNIGYNFVGNYGTKG